MCATAREPAPLNYFKRVQLGDVGYVRKGCFHLLFSAGKPLGERQLGVDVPLTFQPLDVGPIINPQPRLPGCLSTNTIQETRAGLETSMHAVSYVHTITFIPLEIQQRIPGCWNLDSASHSSSQKNKALLL